MLYPVLAYAMRQAVTAEDAKTEADALIESLFLRAEQGWIEQHADEYEQGLDKFREALRRFTTGEVKSLSLALKSQGLNVPSEELYPVLAYAGRQMVSADTQAEKESGTRMQARAGGQDKKYNYTKPFEEQVDDWLQGKFPEEDTLILGETPLPFRQVGLSALPMVIDQTHVKYAVLGKNEPLDDHNMGVALLKKLPELLKKPVAIIESATRKNDSLVAVVSGEVNGKQMMAAVNIGGIGYANGEPINVNEITSAQGRSNTVTKLLTDAIEKNNAGEIGVYYFDKKEAQNLYSRAGVQFPGSGLQDGPIHSIFDVGSPVNRKYLEQTETLQFKRWFKNSKVVNRDGTPKVMYHGTASDFWAFDLKKSNDKTGRLLGLGAGANKIYLTEYRASAELAASGAAARTKNGRERVLGLYVSAQKVMDRAEYNRRLQEAYAKYPNSDPRGESYDYKQRDKAVAAVDKQVRAEGYDGVWDKESGEMFVYEPTQVKSATDNIGTFDPKNPDIRYSVRANINTSDKQMEENKKIVANMKSVKDLQGNEFVKGEDLLDNVSEYYGIKPNQPVIWNNEDIGDVNVTRRGIRDSIWHGIGEDKAAAFAAIKDVIEKGRLAHYEKDWKGRGYDTCVIAAPIAINKENGKPMDYIMGIQVKRSGDTQKYYIHEVLLQKNDGSESRSTRTVNTDRNPGGDRPTMNSILESVMKYKRENEGQKNKQMTKESRRATTDDAETQEALNEVTDDPELYSQMAADGDIRAAWQLLMRLHRLTTQGGENALIRKGAFEARLSEIVKKIEEKTGTKYGPIKLRQALRKIYQAMEQSQYSPGEILQYTRELMKNVLDASPGVLVEQDETTKEKRCAGEFGHSTGAYASDLALNAMLDFLRFIITPMTLFYYRFVIWSRRRMLAPMSSASS